jgi:hypothetical protein
VFTQYNTLGLFLCFAAGKLLGVVGPVVYTTWIRCRSLAELGFRRDNLGHAVILGLVLAAVQFLLTLWGDDLPRPVDWVPWPESVVPRSCTRPTTSATAWASARRCSSSGWAWSTRPPSPWCATWSS